MEKHSEPVGPHDLAGSELERLPKMSLPETPDAPQSKDEARLRQGVVGFVPSDRVAQHEHERTQDLKDEDDLVALGAVAMANPRKRVTEKVTEAPATTSEEALPPAVRTYDSGTHIVRAAIQDPADRTLQRAIRTVEHGPTAQWGERVETVVMSDGGVEYVELAPNGLVARITNPPVEQDEEDRRATHYPDLVAPVSAVVKSAAIREVVQSRGYEEVTAVLPLVTATDKETGQEIVMTPKIRGHIAGSVVLSESSAPPNEAVLLQAARERERVEGVTVLLAKAFRDKDILPVGLTTDSVIVGNDNRLHVRGTEYYQPLTPEKAEKVPVGLDVAAFREDRGVSERQLAGELGLSIGKLHEFLEGSPVVTVDQVRDMLQILRVPDIASTALIARYEAQKLTSMEEGRRAPGQLRQMFREIEKVVAEQGGSIYDISLASPADRQLLAALLNSELTSNKAIATSTGISPTHVSTKAGQLLAMLVQEVRTAGFALDPAILRPTARRTTKASERPESVGTLIDSMRRLGGLSQSVLGRRAQMNDDQVERFLRGESRPDPQYVRNILRVLRVPPNRAQEIMRQYQLELIAKNARLRRSKGRPPKGRSPDS